MGLKALALHFTVITALLVPAFPAVAQSQAQSDTVQIVGFGDSLMAGYQLPPNESYTAQLEAALKAEGLNVTITNAGVSGDTTSGGLARIDWSVPDGTQGVIVELGANDALRGISPEQSEKNLDAMLARLKERGIPVVLAGMIAPPNMGGEYAERFNPIYKKLSEKYEAPLYPFFLDGVAAQQSLQLADGMHPNAEGVKLMVERSLPVMQDFVRSILMEKK